MLDAIGIRRGVLGLILGGADLGGILKAGMGLFWVGNFGANFERADVGCHANMHGLMHDGRLRACPSYLLGLLYGCKVMNVLK